MNANKMVWNSNRSTSERRALFTLHSPQARPLTNHIQAILQKTTLPEDVTVVFDMDAYNFS
jgi:hypothetical protein